MRNRRAYEFGYSRWDAAFAGQPYDCADQGHEYGQDVDEYDYYYDDYYYDPTPRPSIRIESRDRDIIRFKLSHLKPHPKTRNVWEDIKCGGFILTLTTGAINNRYVSDFFYDYNCFEVIVSEDRERYTYDYDYGYVTTSPELDLSKDIRFSRCAWKAKCDGNVGRNLTYEEVVDVIAHCVKLGRLRTFA